jgi:hypothetical protein
MRQLIFFEFHLNQTISSHFFCQSSPILIFLHRQHHTPQHHNQQKPRHHCDLSLSILSLQFLQFLILLALI